jgi:hypothetical protein
MKVHNLSVTGTLTSGGENIGSISSSVAITNNAQDGRLTSLESTAGSITSKTGSYSTTGSNVFVGNQTISGSIIPAVNGLYDLGSSTHEFRHLYLSSASLYIDGTKVLGSTTQELQITTDTGQSFKILEAGSDTITLQSADGNITLATSGGGDVILDPTTGIIALKGSTQVYAGNRILSSDGNNIHFGNGVTISGSLLATGTNIISGSQQISDFGYTTTSSVNTISSSINTRINSISNIQATTGSNNFVGTQTITGSLYISQNLIVQGSSSLQDVTGSNVYIGTNKINLNTNTPSVRFGGVSVFDSGSNFGESGSLLWDSQNNRWVYQHPASSGAPYKSAIIIAGPQNSGSLGSEITLTSGKISKAVGDDHIGDSIMTEIGGGIGISGSLSITGSIVATGTSLWSGSGQLPSGIISGSAQLSSGTVSGSVQVDVMSTTNIARLATTGSNTFNGNQIVTGSITNRGVIIDGANNGNIATLNLTRTDNSWGINNETNLRIYVGSGNTTSPSTKVLELTTAGDMSLTGSLSTTGNGTFRNGVNIGANSLGGDRMFQVSGTAFTTGTSQFSSVFNTTFSGTITNVFGLYAGNNFNTGTTTNSYNLYIEATSAGSATVTNKFGIYQAGGSDKNYFAGNVGIGVSPSSIFHVKVPESVSNLSGVRIEGDTNGKLIVLGAYSTYSWIQSHGSVPIRINELGNDVILNLNGGSVGIGTSSVTNKLIAVASNTGTQITTVPIAKFVNTGNNISKMIIGSDNSNYDAVVSLENNATLSSNKLRIYIGNGTTSTAGHSNDQIVLQGDGKVGIGTTDLSGTAKFLVNGNIGLAGDTDKYFYMPDVGQGTGSIYMQAGYGSSAAGGAIRLYGHNATTYGGGDVEVGLSGKGSFLINSYIGGGRLVTVKSNGNVGINDTNPSTPLDVNGNVRFQGTTMVGSNVGLLQFGMDGARFNSYGYSHVHIKTSILKGSDTMISFNLRGYYYSPNTIDTDVAFYNYTPVGYVYGVTQHEKAYGGITITMYYSSDNYVCICVEGLSTYGGFALNWINTSLIQWGGRVYAITWSKANTSSAQY